jgi:hypothetical protein
MGMKSMRCFVLRYGNDVYLAATDGTAGNGAGALRPVETILQEQLGLVKELERLVSGKSNEALTQPDNDGGWGVVDIVSHLLDWQRITEDRIRQLLHDDHPHLEGIDDSLWAVEHNYRENDPLEVLAALRQHREDMIEELQDLPEDAWERPGTDDRNREITLHWLMNRACEHDARHLAQARDVLA